MLKEDSASSVESDDDQMDDDGNALDHITVAEILSGKLILFFPVLRNGYLSDANWN